MGQEVLYCSVCGKQLRSLEFEKKAAFRVGGQAACSGCAPEVLKGLPPDQLRNLLSLLDPERASPTPTDPEPDPPPRTGPLPATDTRRRPARTTTSGPWFIGGFLAVVALGVAFWVLSGRSEKGAGLPPAESGESKVSPPGLPTPRPPSSPAAPSFEAPLFREACEYARTNPDDLRGQWERYEKADRATQGLPGHDDVHRTVEGFRAKLQSAMRDSLSSLEGPIGVAVAQEKFGDALRLLGQSGTRYPEGEWQSASANAAKRIRNSAEVRYEVLREEALLARRNGSEAGVRAVRDRVAAWGLADLVGDLNSALARAAATEPEGPANPGVAKKDGPKKEETPVDAPAPASDAKPAPPKSPPVPPEKKEALRVDAAIRKGIEYLKGAGSPGWEWWNGNKNSHELILLTFLHSGIVPESDPKFQEYFKEMMAAPPQRTYSAALQAMVLEELDRVRYQGRIAQCAQYLVDTQCTNGQWSYGTTLDLPEYRWSGEPKKVVTTPAKLDASGRRVKPKVTRKIAVAKRMDGPAGGDNSNSQYAALGLRACQESGIVVPRETLDRAMRWWRECQQAEEKAKGAAAGSSAAGLGRGWGYDPRSTLNGTPTYPRPYAAMTAGAAGSLIILDHLVGMDWKKDPAVKAGIRWITTHFSVEENVGVHEAYKDFQAKHWLYYYLYALERLGVLGDAPKFGPHEWYPEGAETILRSQAPDGSWNADKAPNQPSEWETCLSILFLKRATRPFVASEDRFARPEQK